MGITLFVDIWDFALKCRPTKNLYSSPSGKKWISVTLIFVEQGYWCFTKDKIKNKKVRFSGRRPFSGATARLLQQKPWFLGYVEPAGRRYCWIENKVVNHQRHPPQQNMVRPLQESYTYLSNWSLLVWLTWQHLLHTTKHFVHCQTTTTTTQKNHRYEIK